MKAFRTASKLTACFLLGLFVLSCATLERTESDDPFATQLDNYYAKRQTAQTWMFACAFVLATGVIGGTVFTTMNSLNAMDQNWAVAGIVASYSISALATGWGTYQFYNFNKAFNEYLETLRLQSQYYNTLEWAKKTGQ